MRGRPVHRFLHAVDRRCKICNVFSSTLALRDARRTRILVRARRAAQREGLVRLLLRPPSNAGNGIDGRTTMSMFSKAAVRVAMKTAAAAIGLLGVAACSTETSDVP